jgi:hypothetical protein
MGTKSVNQICLINIVIESSIDPSASQNNFTATTTSFHNESSDHSNKKNKHRKNPEKNNINQNSESRINNSTRNYNEQPVIPSK